MVWDNGKFLRGILARNLGRNLLMFESFICVTVCANSAIWWAELAGVVHFSKPLVLSLMSMYITASFMIHTSGSDQQHAHCTPRKCRGYSFICCWSSWSVATRLACSSKHWQQWSRGHTQKAGSCTCISIVGWQWHDRWPPVSESVCLVSWFKPLRDEIMTESGTFWHHTF